jgi:hypothetical protein
MARHEQIEHLITFQEGNAEARPFPERSFNLTLSCTMLEEVDADRAIAELVRVTTPGGRVGIIVRAMDMPWWVNILLDARLKSTLEAPSRLGSGVQAQGCADASLYQRLKDAGLVQVQMSPQWATYTAGTYLQTQRGKLRLNLTPEDTQRCREALTQVEAAGTFLMAEPFHCAVGTKPSGAPGRRRDHQRDRGGHLPSPHHRAAPRRRWLALAVAVCRRWPEEGDYAGHARR